MIKITFSLAILLVSFQSVAKSAKVQKAYKTNQDRYESQLKAPSRQKVSPFKAVTMNLGLLQSPSEVPNFDQRGRLLSSQLTQFLQTESPDVMLLQEAWNDNPDNIATIRSVALSTGYISLQEVYESQSSQDSTQSRNGLDILVKVESLSVDAQKPEVSFAHINKSLLGKLGGYDRGLLYAKLKLKSGTSILVATSHFTPNLAKPLYNQDSTRREQARQSAAILKSEGADVDFVLIGADMNFSPEFEHKINDGRTSDAKDRVWQGSTESYPIFVDMAELVDTYKAVNSDVGYTQDRLLNPMSNVSPSTDGEPEQRLDYIWMGSYKNGSSFKILKSLFVFDSPLLDQNQKEISAEVYEGPLYMSDHFGVATEFELY